MAILVDKNTKILVQGITGKSGLQVARELLDFGMNIVGGVNPAKGGQEVFGLPVFASVAEAQRQLGKVDVSMVYVPPLAAYEAAMEAVEAKIPLVHIFVEKIPVFDTSRILFAAEKNGVRILGPASVGAISPGRGKIGSIGGPNPDVAFSKGPVGVISKSGGMTSEISAMLSRAGLGQSTAVGIGGDLLIGTAFADLLLMFEGDSETRAVVAFGEVGGRVEVEAAELVAKGKVKKPLIVFMAGKFAETLPKDTSLGHAGAIVGMDFTMEEKIKVLRDAGVIVVEDFEKIPNTVKNALG